LDQLLSLVCVLQTTLDFKNVQHVFFRIQTSPFYVAHKYQSDAASHRIEELKITDFV